MLFRQCLRPESGCASYLVGCTGHGLAVAVDVRAEWIEPMCTVLDQRGMRLMHVIETHIQSDHISAGRELAAQTGATYVAHHAAPLAVPFEPVHDGDGLDADNVRVTVWETPCHSDDALALLITDQTRADEPWLVLTGDTMFVGDAGRPDLRGRGKTEHLPAARYDSLQRLLQLPHYVAVYPAHFAGSVCGRGLSATPASTIGFERRHNPALSPRSREAFVTFMMQDLPEQPPEFARIREINRGLIPASAVPGS